MPAGFERVDMPSGPAWRRYELQDPGPTAVAGRDGFCYLDTETTGLSGGTGTMVFTAAVARSGGGGLEVVQMFLPEPGGERAFLEALGEELLASPSIATYNGASFDLPILRTRWTMTRLQGGLPTGVHTDLLHLVRGLVGFRLASRTLREVEMRLLGFEREDDLPGALVPDAYFQYLRHGSSPLLEAALAHNRQDAASLYHLHLRLLDRLALRERGLDADDLLAIGRVLTRRGRRADGWRALRRSAAFADGPAAAVAAMHLARVLVKRGRSASAESLLARAQSAVPDDTPLTVMRARILEWRLRDPAAALALVDQALGCCTPELRAELEHRRARLARKAAGLAGRRHLGDDRVGVQQRSLRSELLKRLDERGVEVSPLIAQLLDRLGGAESRRPLPA